MACKRQVADRPLPHLAGVLACDGGLVAVNEGALLICRVLGPERSGSVDDIKSCLLVQQAQVGHLVAVLPAVARCLK